MCTCLKVSLCWAIAKFSIAIGLAFENTQLNLAVPLSKLQRHPNSP